MPVRPGNRRSKRTIACCTGPQIGLSKARANIDNRPRFVKTRFPTDTESAIIRGFLAGSERETLAPHRIAGSGSAAFLVTPDGRYLMQLRDAIDGIWFPGHWGLFGGAVDDGEAPLAAIHRELAEELGLTGRTVTYFSQVIFDLGDPEAGFRRRYFYEVPIAEAEVAGLRLREGQAMRLFRAEELLGADPPLKLVPYDAFGILLHVNRAIIRASRHIP